MTPNQELIIGCLLAQRTNLKVLIENTYSRMSTVEVCKGMVTILLAYYNELLEEQLIEAGMSMRDITNEDHLKQIVAMRDETLQECLELYQSLTKEQE